jgi:hypothetical protein
MNRQVWTNDVEWIAVNGVSSLDCETRGTCE